MVSCPISSERIDERVARAVGWAVFLTASGYLVAPSPLWLVLLLVDFTARALYRPASPFVWLLRPLALRFGEPRIVDAAPKIFAAKIGWTMSLAALALHLEGGQDLARLVVGVMALCALLEGAMGYCVGCTLYGYYARARRR
ncbi:DUF4395 domain-containing protein [Hydrogenimonas sp.]